MNRLESLQRLLRLLRPDPDTRLRVLRLNHLQTHRRTDDKGNWTL